MQLGAAAQEQEELALAVNALAALGECLVDSPSVETLNS